ncbi:uncharacterized protein PV09_04179 [Verruconis gallopava]|uniref:BZIP domain-containing protein n=1 Tax=Verruconis gallopava TaxID=253628 RepID=A0A0D2B145_9PEZI|nr:uncharacterized protein PV09_04179 [Verruconis gallopava]KIW05024.1 hypothetical protein PV09_04179 [Verruconis gallopava]
MSTTHFPSMAFQPQHQPQNQCVDPSDMENWVDFSNLASPTPGSSNGKGKMPAVTSMSHSTMASPTSTALPLDADDQAPIAPSHDYGRFKQQTGLPTGSIAGLRPLNDDQNMFGSFNSGIDESSFGFFDGMGSQSGLGSMTGDLAMDSSLPPFFYPNDSQASAEDFVDPTAIQKQEEAQANIRYYPGMHQQVAQMRAQQQAAAQRQQMIAAQQKQQREARKASPIDAHAEETIARVVNQIRQNSMMHASMSPEHPVMPTMVRKQKDEDEMDEDERLLNSEEGKKLSSKERRQLRNKVSARAFRSRRKEYIGQLEGEVALKTNEVNELRLQNRALMEENARFRSLTEKLLAHQAFRPFLEELSRDPEIASSFAAVVSNSTSAAAQSATPQPQIKKDVNPYGQPQQFGGNQTQHVGMTLVPEPQVDFSQLSWNMGNMGLSNFSQPQVFAVTSVPDEPVDVPALSGKYSSEEDAEAPAFEETKKSTPAAVELPGKDEVDTLVEAQEIEVTTTPEFDEQDPAYTLYATATAPSTVNAAQPTLEDAIALIGQLPTSKTSVFDLVSQTETESVEMSPVFERSCARLDAACRRLDALFASLRM